MTTIHNWWVKDQYQIGFTIGTVFGAIGKMLQAAISGLASMAGTALQTTMSNAWLLMTPGGHAQLATMIALAEQADAKHWASDRKHETFLAGLAAGVQRAYSGPTSPTIHLHIENVNVQGTKQGAMEFINQAANHAKTALGTLSLGAPQRPTVSGLVFGSP